MTTNVNGDFRETEPRPEQSEWIGALPADWHVVVLRDKYIFTQKPRGLRYDAFESIPFVPMELIPFRKIAFHDYILKKPNGFSSGTYFEAGDFLLPKITPSFENGKQGIIPQLPNGFGVATTEVIPIKGIEGASDIGFLFYYLLKNDVRVALAGKMEGSTGRQRLSKAVVESLLIPFPPLPEQRAIARVLSTIQRAIEAQDNLIAAARELKKSLMRQLFTRGLDANGAVQETEIGVMPEHWDLQELGAVAEIVYGAQAAVANLKDKNVGTPILTNINITNEGNLDLTTLRYYPVPANKRERLVLTKGDLLFNWRSGSQEHVGKTALFNLDGEYTFASFILRFRVNERMHNIFLHFYLQYLKAQKFFAQKRDQSSVNSVFNASKAQKIPVLLPSLSEQREIARILATADKKIENEEKRKAALEALFKTMLQQLMTGKLRMRDEG